MKEPNEKEAEQIGESIEAAKTAISDGLGCWIHDVLFGDWRTDNLDEPKIVRPDETTRTE
jgi:hypothetical protein